MLRTASRAFPRRAWAISAPRAGARHLSTAPPHLQSRSWKNSAARWGIAAAGIYWYNTTTVFAEEPPPHLIQQIQHHDDDTSHLPTIDSLSPSARRKTEAEAASTAPSTTQIAAEEPTAVPGDDIEGLEEEAHSEGAFNPETGEINWDCPCLGGMAYGPCGTEFREAFSCFVFSTDEPKGMDCIDRFKNMQNCFRQHPEVYGAELEGDEEDDEDGAGAGHADGNVAAASPEDRPQVAALAEKIKDEDTKNQAQSTTTADAPKTEEKTEEKKDAQVAAKKAPAPESEDTGPAPSRTLKEPQAENRKPVEHQDIAADEGVIPHEAHDARKAPVPKKAEK